MVCRQRTKGVNQRRMPLSSNCAHPLCKVNIFCKPCIKQSFPLATRHIKPSFTGSRNYLENPQIAPSSCTRSSVCDSNERRYSCCHVLHYYLSRASQLTRLSKCYYPKYFIVEDLSCPSGCLLVYLCYHVQVSSTSSSIFGPAMQGFTFVLHFQIHK